MNEWRVVFAPESPMRQEFEFSTENDARTAIKAILRIAQWANPTSDLRPALLLQKRTEWETILIDR